MKPIYRASFQLSGNQTPAQFADEIALDSFCWALDPKRRRLGRDYVTPTRAETVEHRTIGKGYEIEALNASSASVVAWGMRFSNQDDDPDVRWTTELSVYSIDGERCQFSCSVFLAREGDAYAPVRRHSSRPRIVRDVLAKFSGKGGFALDVAPIIFNAEQSELFAQVLQSSLRTHPILFISPPDGGLRSPLDESKIADQLAGVAHVIITREHEATWRLKDFIPNELNCYGGAVRLYWPGFSASDSPYAHPLWLFPRIESMWPDPTSRFAQTILDRVADVAVYNLHERFLTWDRLQDIARRRALAEARAAGSDAEMIELYEEEVASLTKQNKAREEEVARLSEQLGRQQHLAEDLQREIEEQRQELQAAFYYTPSRSVAEAVAKAEHNFADRLVFSLNSKSDEQSPFRRADEVARAFEWLATTYHDAMTGKERCPDLPKHFAETLPRWSYNPHQNEGTVKANAAWYHCPSPFVENQKLEISEHFKCGISRRPEETIRIAFAWVREKQKVVVGFIGQHQENKLSN